jgi:uncharacterized membrane protein YbhN (UPF0104 family)
VSKAEAIYSIFLARLTNMWGALLIPLPIILITNFSTADRFYRVVFLFSLLIWICTLFTLILKNQLYLIMNKISTIDGQFLSYLKHFLGGQLVYLLFSSIAFHLTNVVVHYFFAKAVGIDLGFSLYLIIVPSVLFLTSIPIAVNGIGVREGSFILALNVFLVSPEKSLALSFLSFSQSIFLGIVGGMFFLIGSMQTIGKNS